jgi:putative OPT family oligopeptide transporter
MSNNTVKEKEFAKIPQLSLRAILVGMFGSCIITASSMYVALRISALPWPTIFVAVLSMALLKALRETTLNEINITQTAMSAGAMVAGGLAFTLPGLWITGLWNSTTITSGHFWKVLAIALAGMILGTLLTWFLRPRFVEKEDLPYPIGAAAAETIITGDSGGKKSAVLFGTMAFSAVFTFLRDSLGWIPSALSSKWLYAKNFFVGVWVSPMAVGIGYMIGTLYTGVWFLGAVLSYLLIIPLGPVLGLFPSAEAAAGFKNTAGIGLMVGTGAGILISYIFSLVKKLVAGKWAKKATVEKLSKRTFSLSRLLTILSVAVAFALSIACGLGVLPSLLLIAGVFVVSAMAAIITGQTGVNPMEIFGIIVLLAIRLIINVDTEGAFFIAACVAVACGYAGDLLNDYKTGQILGTNPLAQLVSQFIGGVAGTVVAAAAMFAIIAQFGGVGPDKGLPAGQAFAVSQMVNGIGQPLVFGIAVLIGAVLYLLKVPVMTLGIGMYLPFEISSVVFIGGLTRLISSRLHPKSGETGNIAASGLLGGEGVTGVAVAIIKMITGG